MPRSCRVRRLPLRAFSRALPHCNRTFPYVKRLLKIFFSAVAPVLNTSHPLMVSGGRKKTGRQSPTRAPIEAPDHLPRTSCAFAKNRDGSIRARPRLPTRTPTGGNDGWWRISNHFIFFCQNYGYLREGFSSPSFPG